MNTQANAMHEPFQREIAAPAQITVGRAFYWAVRRELWENPSLYIWPLWQLLRWCSWPSQSARYWESEARE